MQLIYLYIDGYCNFYQEEFNFNPEVHLHFKPEMHTVTVSDTKFRLPDEFWGENINNLCAVVGNNGAGKTSLIQYIIELFLDAHGYRSATGRGMLIFGEGNTLYEYCSDTWSVQPVRMNLKSSKYRWVKYLHRFEAENVPSRTKLIYLTNVLNMRDSRRNQWYKSNRTTPLYDCSVGSVLVSDIKTDANRIYQEGFAKSIELDTYFLYEQYKQIKFVFDKHQHKICEDLKSLGYPVPIPERLYIDMKPDGLLITALNIIDPTDIWFDSGLSPIEDTVKQFFPNLYIYRNNTELKKCDPYTLFQYELAWCAIWCAVKSVAPLMDGKQREMLTEFLFDWEGHLGSCVAIFQTIWDKIQAIKANGSQQNIAWEILDSSYDCYIDFLKFIETEPLDEHFKIETDLRDVSYKGDGCLQQVINDKFFHDIDLDSITFSIATTDEWFIDFIQKYRYICNPDYFLDFRWNLSSGENSLLSLFASLYYIYEADFANPKNGDYQIWNEFEQSRRVQCDSIILLIDEADLTYHPEWQRLFIDLLTAFLPKVYPPQCCLDIQIILTTHSPILLSDVPQQSVIYLKYEPETRRTKVVSLTQGGTFGQNIHLLYKNSFFLENGTIGHFAQRKIKTLVEELQRTEENLESDEKVYWVEKLEYQLRPCAELIAEPIIRRKVLTWIDTLEKKLSPDECGGRFQKMSNEELKQEIKKLQEELRRRKHD